MGTLGVGIQRSQPWGVPCPSPGECCWLLSVCKAPPGISRKLCEMSLGDGEGLEWKCLDCTKTHGNECKMLGSLTACERNMMLSSLRMKSLHTACLGCYLSVINAVIVLGPCAQNA